MAKTNEQIEDLLDTADDHEKRLKAVESQYSNIERLLTSIQSSLNQQPKSTAAPVAKVDLSDIQGAANAGIDNYFLLHSPMKIDLTDDNCTKLASICRHEYSEGIRQARAKIDEDNKKAEEEEGAKLDLLKIHTVEQIAEWAPEYSPAVLRLVRWIGLNLIPVDEPIESAHAIMKVVGDWLTASQQNSPPPTLWAWIKYRFSLIRNYAHKKKTLTYILLLFLILFSIVSLSIYQDRVMKVDRTNHLFFNTFIRSRMDEERYQEIDSLLYKDGSFYDRLLNSK